MLIPRGNYLIPPKWEKPEWVPSFASDAAVRGGADVCASEMNALLNGEAL
jgi:hypothetical protein